MQRIGNAFGEEPLEVQVHMSKRFRGGEDGSIVLFRARSFPSPESGSGQDDIFRERSFRLVSL